MTTNENLKKIKKILSTQLSFEIELINEASILTKDLGADSLDIAEISMMIEEDFGYALTDKDMPQIKTVGDLLNCIEEAQQVKK